LTAVRRSLPEWLAFQQRLHPRSIELGLERVRAVAQRLGLLPFGGRIVIVGGTNGKGSTATTLASLLTATGHKSGLFTSPHLLRYHERIRVDGRTPRDAELVAAFEQIEAVRDGQSLTFFEYNTLAALLWFREQGVDCTVLEVGLGGRLDATNIVDADVAILCSVAFDHTEWLGTTLEQIGREKAGIFRPERAVVLATGEMPASVYEVARQLECPLQVAGRDFDWQLSADGSWTFIDQFGAVSLPAPALPGAIQYRNTAAALAALRLLPGLSAVDAVRLSAGLKAVHLPGRLQRIPGRVEWLLDVAHNEAAAVQLAEALSDLPAVCRTVAVCGMLEDKDVAGVMARMAPHIDHWILCTIAEARGLSAAELQRRAGGHPQGTIELADDIEQGCRRAAALTTRGDRIVVFGSFHAVGPALQWLGLY